MSSLSGKIARLLWKLSAAVAVFRAITFADAFLINPKIKATLAPAKLFSAATDVGTAPVLKQLLKKSSKVLTVGVEYDPEEPSEGSLEILSMKLRQQAKVSFVVCSDLPTIKQFSAEQETARGNFPGPLPVVYFGVVPTSLTEISEAGASAIVIDAASPESLSCAESASSTGLETIWKVSSVEQAQLVLKSTNDSADVFLLDIHSDVSDATLIPQIIEVLPKSSMSIAVLQDPMQEEGAEIETGKEFKSMGCASVFVKKACVGDKEDVDYASFVVSGLTSKASKEFKFSGLTGSTNGHFGGIQSNSSVKWDRMRRLAADENDTTDTGDEL